NENRNGKDELRSAHTLIVLLPQELRKKTCRSPTFVPIGPVTTRSPSRWKNGYESCATRAAFGSSPAAAARDSVVESTIAPAASVGPSMPSVPTLASAQPPGSCSNPKAAASANS